MPAARVLTVTVRTPLLPSEDPAKVRRAVTNIFSKATLEVRDGWLEASTNSLDDFRSLVRRQKILDAARKTLLRSLDASGTRATFELAKQAAAVGRLSFALENSPLGNLTVTVEGPGLEALFREIAPMTIRGIPVSEERAAQEIARRRARKTQETEPEDEEAEGDEASSLEDKTGGEEE